MMILKILKSNYNVAIITPDKDIIPGADTLNPAYIVFDNYEIISNGIDLLDLL